jgi:polysaccharide deactylase WbmS-like protein
MSTELVNPFAELLDKPIFVLTSDLDWAPDWALRAMLEVVATRGVPLHLFVTNASEALHEKPAGVTLGIHPNFLANSTQGTSIDDIIDFCQAIVPDADTFRSHSISENNHILLNLASRGFIADSNLVTFLQPGLMPVIHGSGLLRFPVFFEDDVFLWWAAPELRLAALASLLFSSGLKVLNFHPALVAINAPSIDYYNARRSALFGSSKTRKIEPYYERGVATLLAELIDTIKGGGFDFIPFPQLIARAQTCMGRAFPDGLYRWPYNPALGMPRTAPCLPGPRT